MDESDATLPVPKPLVPTSPDDHVTPAEAGGLLAAAAGLFDTRPSTASRAWQPPAVEVLQELLPQYDISAFIARGGMGAVYRGTQKALKRAVAIKVMPPEVDDGVGDMQFAARFKQEAQAMAQLSHPNIVAVFDAGEVAAPGGGLLLYFVMEFIEGTDVAQLIASEGRLEPARAVPIITAVCEALAFAHEEGIIHRDIKPSNVMIDKRGRVKVADFGLAKTINIESTLITRSDVAMGTPDFLAPEALSPGTKVDGRADVYAVGVMLYQMLTGQIPRGRFALPSVLLPQVDRGFDAIVDKAMQTDRDKRYSTATQMRQDVEKVGGHSVAAAAVPTPEPPRSKGGTMKKLGIVFSATLSIIFGISYLRSRPGATPENKVPVAAMTNAEHSVPAPAPSTDRERNAAQRVLVAGGSVVVQTGSGKSLKVTHPAALPAETFAVVEMETASRNQFNDADMAALAGLPKLQKIELYQTKVTGKGLQVLPTLPALAYLELDWNKAFKDDDLQVLQKCPQLRGLSFRHPEQLTSAALRFLPTTPGLAKLELVDFPWEAEDFGLLLKHTKLQHLDISGVPLSADQLEALHQLPELLELRFTMPEDGRPVAFSRFPKLKRASLAHGITVALVKDLAGCARLEQLGIHVPGKLNQKGVDEDVIREIAWSLKSLNTLSLSLDYPLQGSAQLSPLAALPSLQTVVVAQHGGVNPFDDTALMSLEKVSSLRTLTFAATQHRVTRQGIAEFQKRRPDVKLEGPGAAGAPTPTAASTSAVAAHAESAKAFPPGKWTKVWQKPEDIPEVDKNKITEGWALISEGRSRTSIPGLMAWNGGLRARFRFRESEPHAQLRLRDQAGKGWNVIIGYAAIHFRTHDLSKTPDYQNQEKYFTPLPKEGEEYQIELVAIGRTLFAKLNGKSFSYDMGEKAGPASHGGMYLLQTHFNPFRDVEVINLDGLSEAEARKAAGVETADPATAPAPVPVPAKDEAGLLAYPTGTWARCWRDEDLPPKVARTDGPWMLMMGINHGSDPRTTKPMLNVGLRARFRGQRTSEKDHPQINLRSQADGSGSVNFFVDNSGRRFSLRLVRDRKLQVLADLPLREPLLPGKEYLMEFYVIGGTLIGRIDGQEITAEAADLPAGGHVGIYYANGDFVRDVEVLNLDGLSEADARKMVKF